MPLPVPPRDQNLVVRWGCTPLSISQEPGDAATTPATITSQGPLVILLQRIRQTEMLLLEARRVCLRWKPRSKMELVTAAPALPTPVSPIPISLLHWVLLSPSLNGEGGATRGQGGRDCCDYKLQKGHSSPRARVGSLKSCSVGCCRSQDPHHESPSPALLVCSALLGLR